MIPFFGCEREYVANKWEYLKVIDKVLSTGQLLQGEVVEKFENRLARFSSKAYAVAVNSCTDALFFALKAAGVGPGDEVLVPAFSFVASISCIARIGATPVFVDIDPDYNMPSRDISDKVTEKTKAVLFVSLYGDMRGIHEIRKFADIFNLTMIEDAAQSFGSLIGVRPGGSFGDISCFSFDPTKPISALGSGGAVVTDREDIAKKVRMYRYHGKDDTSFAIPGYNSQMPTISAAILDKKLDKAGFWKSCRTDIAEKYVADLDSTKDVTIRVPYPKDYQSNYHKFVIEVPNRYELRKFLHRHEIDTRIHYPYTLPELFGDDQEYPNAQRAKEHCVSLPIHPFLTNKEVIHVIETIKKFFS